MKRQLMSMVLVCSSALSPMTAQAAPFQAPGNAKEEVLAVTQQWIEAENKHDAAALGRILDDQFTSSSGTKMPIGKDAFIKAITSGAADPTQSQTLDDQNIIVDGDTAVITGLNSIYRANKAPLKLRYTITYVHREGRWKALAEHVTLVPPNP